MNDDEFFWRRVPGRNYRSRRFGPDNKLMYFNRVFDAEEVQFAKVDDELVLRTTKVRRIEIRATVMTDDRSIPTLVIQKFGPLNDPHPRLHFSFVGKEVENLKRFLAGIQTAPLSNDGRTYISDADLAEIVLSNSQAQKLLTNRPDLVEQIAESEDLTEDLVAIGYRRKQIKVFEAMLSEGVATEPDWQKFFERNRWIFGYGLSYQFLTGLHERPLETVVRGYDVTGFGKRADGLMKTRGRIGSLCFVEIKTPTTDLLQSKPYRSGSWALSSELIGAVTQVQNTSHAAMTQIRERLQPKDEEGNPTGEDLFAFEPKSILVVGNLDQFVTEHGVNVDQYRSFELFRRNTWSPEIITFDELLERARFIVEHTEAGDRT